MKLVIQRRKKFIDEEDYYYDYIELELETYRWNKNHLFEYVPKGSNIWLKLEENEEIVGIGI